MVWHDILRPFLHKITFPPSKDRPGFFSIFRSISVSVLNVFRVVLRSGMSSTFFTSKYRFTHLLTNVSDFFECLAVAEYDIFGPFGYERKNTAS